MIVERTRWLLSTTTGCSKKVPPFTSALGPLSPKDWAPSKAAKPIKIPQKLRKLQNAENSTSSSINLKKLNFRTSTTKTRFNPNSTQSEQRRSPNWKRIWKDYWKIPSRRLPSTSLKQVFRRKSQKSASRKLVAKRSNQETLFQTSMISMKRSSIASRKLKTRLTSTLLSNNPPTSGFSTLQSWNKTKLSSNISKNWMSQSPKTN